MHAGEEVGWAQRGLSSRQAKELTTEKPKQTELSALRGSCSKAWHGDRNKDLVERRHDNADDFYCDFVLPGIQGADLHTVGDVLKFDELGQIPKPTKHSDGTP